MQLLLSSRKRALIRYRRAMSVSSSYSSRRQCLSTSVRGGAASSAPAAALPCERHTCSTAGSTYLRAAHASQPSSQPGLFCPKKLKSRGRPMPECDVAGRRTCRCRRSRGRGKAARPRRGRRRRTAPPACAAGAAGRLQRRASQRHFSVARQPASLSCPLVSRTRWARSRTAAWAVARRGASH